LKEPDVIEMAKIQVLLVEDNRLLRENIAALLNAHGDFDVIARAGDDDAVQQLRNVGIAPDVVLLALGLEKVGSLRLMALLRKELPAAKIIALDNLPNQVNIVEFVHAGGSGLIMKEATLSEYVATIKAVASGEKVLPPGLTESLFSQMADSSLTGGTDSSNAIHLTNREQEIIEMISAGLSNKDMAERLHVSTYTIKSHVHNVLEKLSLNSRLQIAAFANRNRAPRRDDREDSE
jgi:DNA-binding NarL/FixJ family response regulator